MDYGLTILNTNNQIIIDENFENYEIYATGSITTLAATDPFADSYMLPAPNNCLLLISPELYEADVYYSAGYDSVSNAYRIGACSSGTLIPWGNLSRVVHFILLKPIKTLPITQGYGLNVFKPTGELTYSSNHKSINFISSVVITGVDGQTITNTLSLGKRCYVEISALTYLSSYPNGVSYPPYFWYEYSIYRGFRFTSPTTTVISKFSSWAGETADYASSTGLPSQDRILFAEY